MEGSTLMPRKRATMMIDSDEDEENDLLSDLPRPVLKKTRRDVEDIAEGPEDFIKALTEAGFHPRSGDLPNILSVQGSDFQQSLRDHLTSSIHHPRSTEFFVSECDTFFNSRKNFIKALHPTENATALEDSTAMVLPQDSLVRLLLNMEEVQPKLIQSVLKRFADASKEERRQDCTEANLPSLILSQLAWLNRIVDPIYVVDTLLDLLHSSRPAIQKEIISQLPGLVADREQIRVAFALCELLDDADAQHTLTAAVLDALGDLSLPTVEAAELRAKVIKRILNVPLETIPVLLTFVFKRVGSDESARLIREVRLNFDRAFSRNRQRRSLSEETLNDCLSLAVESLQASLIRSKALADTWFKEIQAEVESTNHHCVDFLVLLMEHKLSTRRRPVELLFKRKLRSEAMSADLVKEAFKLYGLVLKNYFDQLRAVADSLLLSKDPLVIPHGSLLYLEMFSRLDEFYQQEVVEALIQHICCSGGGASGNSGGAESPATASLVVLQELADNRWGDLVQFSALAVSLLEYLEYMGLAQIKKVMELLAKMAYGFSEANQSQNRSASFCSSIQSELLMTVKKQLYNRRTDFQRMGVLGAVALVAVLSDPELIGPGTCADVRLAEVNIGSGAGMLSTSTASLSGDQRLQLAKNLMDLVQGCTERAPEVAALFMDEMASLSLLNEMHPALHAYLYDNVSDTFQNAFVVDEDEQPLDGFPVKLTLQLGLDMAEADESNMKPVFVNIGPMTFNEAHRKPGDRSGSKASITTLVSHFRLLRHTIDSYEPATLEDIDALLGCALCLPDDDVLVPDEFDSLAQPDKDAVCRSLFHAVNWLIEVINTFARAKPMRAKVIQRVRDVILLKEKFYRCLARNPTFLPPPSVFYGEPIRSRAQQPSANGEKKAPAKKTGGAKGKGKGKGKKKTDQTADGTTMLTSQQNKTVFHSTPMDASGKLTGTNRLDFLGTQNGAGTAEGAAESVQSTFIVHFRELDQSAFLLLSSALDLSSSSTPSSSLSPKDLEFMLIDLSAKVQHKLLPCAAKRRFPPVQSASGPGSEGGEAAFVMLDLYDPLEVAKRCVSLTKRLCCHLESVSGFFQQLIETNDGLLDAADMFAEPAGRLARCYRLIFRILHRIFSWHGLQKASTGTLLKEDALRFLAGRIRPEDAKTAAIPELTASCFTYVEKFAESVSTFDCAVEHVRLAAALLNHLPETDAELSDKLVTVAEGYLKRGWSGADGQPEKGNKFNAGVEYLLQVFLLSGTGTLDKIERIAKTAVPEVLRTGGTADGSGRESLESESFRTCNKSTYAVYFRAAFLALVESAKKIPGSHGVGSVQAELDSWDRALELLDDLVASVKNTERRSVLTACLKHGRAIVDLFYRLVMPLLDKQFKNFPNESQELFRKLQKGTRTLQQVCNHAKTSRDPSLAAHIPAWKKCQELLLFRVRTMLAANGCADAFWMGNLKNKDLKGHEITVSEDESSSEGENEPVASDDEPIEAEVEEEDDDVTVLNEDDGGLRLSGDDDSRSREF